MKRNPAAPIQLSPVQKAICLIWLDQQNPDPTNALYTSLSKHEQETCQVAFDRLWERYQGGESDLVFFLSACGSTSSFFGVIAESPEFVAANKWLFDFVLLDLFGSFLKQELCGMWIGDGKHLNRDEKNAWGEWIASVVAACMDQAAIMYKNCQEGGNLTSLFVVLTKAGYFAPPPKKQGNPVTPKHPFSRHILAIWDGLLYSLFLITWPNSKFAEGCSLGADQGIISTTQQELCAAYALPTELPMNRLLHRAEIAITQEILRLCPK